MNLVENLLLSPTMKAFKQELSYRKQIAHQLRTLHDEGISSNPVTL